MNAKEHKSRGDDEKGRYSIELDDAADKRLSYDRMFCPEEESDELGERKVDDFALRKDVDETNPDVQKLVELDQLSTFSMWRRVLHNPATCLHRRRFCEG